MLIHQMVINLLLIIIIKIILHYYNDLLTLHLILLNLL